MMTSPHRRPEPLGNLKLKHAEGTGGGDKSGFTMLVGHAASLGDGAYGKVRACMHRKGGGWRSG